MSTPRTSPALYAISGSAHFINKCDAGLVVHRNRDPENGSLDVVEVLVRKVRKKAVGDLGTVKLRYDRPTGRYEELEGGSAEGWLPYKDAGW